MPSRDPVNEQANLWIKHLEAEKERKPMPARVQVLARARHTDPSKLAEKIPADTLRRLKYPMLIHEEADGTTSFTHDQGIVEGIRPLLATDRTYGQRRD